HLPVAQSFRAILSVQFFQCNEKKSRNQTSTLRIVAASTTPMSPTNRSRVTVRGCSVITNVGSGRASCGPRLKFVPVRRVCAPESATERFHALTPLMGIEQLLDQSCRSESSLSRVAVDSIPQLSAHLDRRRHNLIIPGGIPIGIPSDVTTKGRCSGPLDVERGLHASHGGEGFRYSDVGHQVHETFRDFLLAHAGHVDGRFYVAGQLWFGSRSEE